MRYKRKDKLSSAEHSVSYVAMRRVSAHMNTDVVTMDQHALTRDAVKAMQMKKRDTVIVVDHKKEPLGIVTNSDILSKVGDVDINAELTLLKDIMTSPLITIKDNATLQSALLTMRDHHIKRLPVMRHGQLVGTISRATISQRYRDATTKRATLYSPPVKAILGNLGFVLQFAGVLLLVPAVLSTLLNDTQSATGIYLSTVSLLIVGFFLNSYGEKASLNMQQASILVFSSLFILILFGTMPYVYVNPYQVESGIELFANSFFSSAAGFTTGGISLFEQPEELPQSFTFYRGFTQLVGGMSFIYLVMTAFFPSTKMQSMRGFLTGQRLHLRELFGTITLVFLVYILVMAGLLYILGTEDIIDDVSLAMSTIATGGFLPSSTILDDLSWEESAVLIGGMILGTLPFTLHYGMVRKKSILPKISREIIIYFIILASGILLFYFTSGLDPQTSIFATISASTTAGIQLPNTGMLELEPRMILVILMFIGGCGFSTAGGIKIFRFMQMGSLKRVLLARKTNDKAAASKLKKDKKELIVASIIVGLFPLTALAVAGYFMLTVDAIFEDAFFEATGLVTTGGLSTGIISLETDPATKILMSFVMIFGRLEIIAMIYIFLPKLTD